MSPHKTYTGTKETARARPAAAALEVKRESRPAGPHCATGFLPLFGAAAPERAASVLEAQSRYGNQAVQRMIRLPAIQRKAGCSGNCARCSKFVDEDEIRRSVLSRQGV